MTYALETSFITEFFSYKRPHGSDSEREWIDTFIKPMLPKGKHFTDAVGNIHIDLRTNKRKSKGKARTLFVAHTDTVHTDEGRQTVHIVNNTTLQVTNLTQTNCLGADDGAGVLVLLKLIAAGIPAYYIFTRCEERGGLGAKHLVDKYPMLLGEFDRAVAFDRRGTSSVITYQGWGRCCSDTFAEVLCDQLSNDNLMYAPDDTGVYTDTAEFVDIIPECTNISVGYDHEHTTKETLDLVHLKHLMYRVLAIDWEKLPVRRDPNVREEYEEPPAWALRGRQGKRSSAHYDWDYGREWSMGGAEWRDEVAVEVSAYREYVFDCLMDAESGYCEELRWALADAYAPDDPIDTYKVLSMIPINYAVISDLHDAVSAAPTDIDIEDELVDACDILLHRGGYDE